MDAFFLKSVKETILMRPIVQFCTELYKAGAGRILAADLEIALCPLLLSPLSPIAVPGGTV